MTLKATGIIRKLDDLGRIAIPKEIRNVNNWAEGTPIELYVSDGRVVLQAYRPGCIICGNIIGIRRVGGADTENSINLCPGCIWHISKLAEAKKE